MGRIYINLGKIGEVSMGDIGEVNMGEDRGNLRWGREGKINVGKIGGF